MYYAYNDVPLVLTIDKALLANEGYSGEFAPRRVFGNKQLETCLVYIDNTSNLLLAYYHTELTLLSVIPYSTSGAQIEVGISKQTFFLAQIGDTQSVTEYSYEDITDVKKLKTVQLYGHTLGSPLTADYSDDTGFFFLRGWNVSKDQSVVLVLKPGSLQHDTLFKVIPTGVSAADGQTVLLGGGGSTQMYCYFNDFTAQTTFELLDTPVISIVPSVSDEAFVSEASVDLIATNFGGKSIEYTNKIKVLNTMTNIDINHNKFDENAQAIFGFKQDKEAIPLGNDWFTGQVTQFEIQCDDCGTNINIVNRVNKDVASIIG